MANQDGMRAIGMAIASLADDPYPGRAFHRSDYHRLRVGRYRVIYVVDGDVITIERVDRFEAPRPPRAEQRLCVAEVQIRDSRYR